jgi:Protein of unknown function (DUF1236)
VKTRLMASATAIALAAGTFLVAAQAQPGGGTNPGAQTPGAAQQPSPEPKSGAPKARPQPKTADPKAQNGAPPKSSAQSKEAPPPSGNPASRADDKSAPKRGSKTGAKTDPKADRSANITVNQRTEIRQTIVKSKNAPRVNNVNFNISVGTVVPRSVRVAVLPPRVVTIYPQWRGYRYFIVGDEIIIVEPNTLRIVFVLPA